MIVELQEFVLVKVMEQLLEVGIALLEVLFLMEFELLY
jgi:hypothetical protein